MNDQRISSSVKRPGEDIKRYISPSAKAWNINEAVKNDICLTKINNNPDEIENPPQIICEKSADYGLGETLEKKSITLKFYGKLIKEWNNIWVIYLSKVMGIIKIWYMYYIMTLL